MTNVEKIRAKLGELAAEGSALKASMDELADWDSIPEAIAHARDIYAFGAHVALAVDLAVKELGGALRDLRSNEKLDAAVKFLDDALPLPWYLEWADGPAIRMLLSRAVAELNEAFGHDWDGVRPEDVKVGIVAPMNVLPPAPARVEAREVVRVELAPEDAEAAPERPFRAPEYHAPIPEGRSDRERG